MRYSLPPATDAGVSHSLVDDTRAYVCIRRRIPMADFILSTSLGSRLAPSLSEETLRLMANSTFTWLSEATEPNGVCRIAAKDV